MPGDDEGLPQAVYDRSFEVRHHLEIVVVLDVIARDSGNLSVDDHELGMERSQRWAMEVHDGQIDVWNLLWCWKPYAGRLPFFGSDVLMVVKKLVDRQQRLITKQTNELTCFNAPRSYINFTTTFSPRSPALLDSSINASFTNVLAPENFQKFVARRTSFFALAMRLDICRNWSFNGAMIVMGTQPVDPINGGETQSDMGSRSTHCKRSWKA